MRRPPCRRRSPRCRRPSPRPHAAVRQKPAKPSASGSAGGPRAGPTAIPAVGAVRHPADDDARQIGEGPKGVFHFQRGEFGALDRQPDPDAAGTSCLVRLYSPLERGKAPRLFTVRPSSAPAAAHPAATRAWPTADPAAIRSTEVARKIRSPSMFPSVARSPPSSSRIKPPPGIVAGGESGIGACAIHSIATELPRPRRSPAPPPPRWQAARSRSPPAPPRRSIVRIRLHEGRIQHDVPVRRSA